MAATAGLLRTPRQLAAAAVACVAAFVAVLVVAYGSEPAARADAVALEDFSRPLREPLLARAAVEIAQLADPAPFALATLALALLGLFLHGFREAAAAAVMVAGANVSTQVLKPILATPRGTLGGWTVGPEAFPSGHATAAMSLALAAVFISRRRWRPLVALAGAGFAIAVGFALVAIDAHFPSDVAGGYLMAAAWCFAALAVLAALERRRPRPREPEREPAAGSYGIVVLLLGALAAAAIVGATQLPGLLDYARGHTTFAVVAAATAALATALVAATAAAASSSPRA